MRRTRPKSTLRSFVSVDRRRLGGQYSLVINAEYTNRTAKIRSVKPPIVGGKDDSCIAATCVRQLGDDLCRFRIDDADMVSVQYGQPSTAMTEGDVGWPAAECHLTTGR